MSSDVCMYVLKNITTEPHAHGISASAYIHQHQALYLMLENITTEPHAHDALYSIVHMLLRGCILQQYVCICSCMYVYMYMKIVLYSCYVHYNTTTNPKKQNMNTQCVSLPCNPHHHCVCYLYKSLCVRIYVCTYVCVYLLLCVYLYVSSVSDMQV